MTCKCEGQPGCDADACERCDPGLAKEIAAADARYKQAPCLECGAGNATEAETMCRCSGDKDDCHGCHLWPGTD